LVELLRARLSGEQLGGDLDLVCVGQLDQQAVLHAQLVTPFDGVVELVRRGDEPIVDARINASLVTRDPVRARLASGMPRPRRP
jgi:hypothetical protein